MKSDRPLRFLKEMAPKRKRSCKAELPREVPLEKLLTVWSTDPDANIAGQICKCMTRQKMYKDLEVFLKSLPEDKGLKESEEIVKGTIACFLEKKNYDKVYKLIEVSALQPILARYRLLNNFFVCYLLINVFDFFEQENTFSDKECMVKVWDEAHYQQHQAFTSLARFRVRER